MLDAQGRLTIGGELMERAYGCWQDYEKVKLLLDLKNKAIQVIPEYMEGDKDLYFIRTTGIDNKKRIFIPKIIRNAFPKAIYMPTVCNNKVCILII